MFSSYWKAGVFAGCLAMLALCACSPDKSPSAQAQDIKKVPNLDIPAVELSEKNVDGALTSWSLIHPPPTQKYPGLTFSVDYQDQDKDGYMETVHLFVGTPAGSHCVTFKDNDQDDSPDFVICTKIPPGLFTSDLDGDGRFDLYKDAETEKLKIIAGDSLVKVPSVEGLGRDGVSSSKLPEAISVKDGTTYVFADGIWTRQD